MIRAEMGCRLRILHSSGRMRAVWAACGLLSLLLNSDRLVVINVPLWGDFGWRSDPAGTVVVDGRDQIEIHGERKRPPQQKSEAEARAAPVKDARPREYRRSSQWELSRRGGILRLRPSSASRASPNNTRTGCNPMGKKNEVKGVNSLLEWRCIASHALCL